MPGSVVSQNLSLPPLTMVIGGARSGKSALAEGLAMRTGLPRVYVATAEAWDDEMRARIALHRDRREGWTTLEAPRDVAGALAGVSGAVVLLDCATLWLTNVMLGGGDVAAEEAALLAALSTCACPVVVVTNEVGLSIVPENALARAFRDAQGRLNQRLAAEAGLVVAVWAGLPLVLKGGIPMVTRFWWVRHGPTHAKCMVGWTDLAADLSDMGAIARLSAHLPGDAVVVSSDLSRAVATADALQGARQRLPHDRDLREIHFGTWEMRGFAEVQSEAPDHIRAFWETPGDISAPGGESWNALAARVHAATDRLLAAHPGRDIIVTAHFGAILAALQRAEGLSPEAVFAHRIENLSVTCLTHGDTGWVTGAVNHRP